MSRLNSRIKRIEKEMQVGTLVLNCPTLMKYLNARAEHPKNLVLMNFFRSKEEADAYRSNWKRDVNELKGEFEKRGQEFSPEIEEMLLAVCK